MGIFKTLVSGTLALFMSVVILKHSAALGEVDEGGIVDPTSSLLSLEVETCGDLWESYGGTSPIAVHVKADMMCTRLKTVHATGSVNVMFFSEHASFSNIRFIVEQEASVTFTCNSVLFGNETPGQDIFEVHGNLDFIAGSPSPYFADFAGGNKEDVHGLVKASDSATIRFVEGEALYTDTSIVIASPPPVHGNDEAVVVEDIYSTGLLTDRQLVELSLEQVDEDGLQPDNEVLGPADIESDFDVATGSAGQQMHGSPGEDELVEALEVSGSDEVAIYTCDDLAASYAATKDQDISLNVMQDIITCEDKKVVHILGDGIVFVVADHTMLENVHFAVGEEAKLSFIVESAVLDSTQEPRAPILDVKGMVHVDALQISPHHVDSWKEDKKGLVSLTGSGMKILGESNVSYTDTKILLEGGVPSHDATKSTAESDPHSAESAGSDDAPPVEHDADRADITADTDMRTSDCSAVPADAVTRPVQPDTEGLKLVRRDDDSELTVTDGSPVDDISSVASVDFDWSDMTAQREYIEQFSASLLQRVYERSTEDTPVPSSPREDDADSDQRQPSTPPPLSSMPPFMRAGPIKADKASLKVGQSVKLSERLVSPGGRAAISLGPDGSIMSSKTSQASAAPAESARQQGIHVDDAGQESAKDEMGEFLVHSKWRKVSRVLKEREYSRSEAETTDFTERTDKVSAEQTGEQSIGDGDADVRGEASGVGVGRRGNRWWNWMGKAKSGSEGKNKVHRREKWRLWGASDARRREVPSPNAAESEDVVMSITDKAVIEVRMDGTRVLSKAGPSSSELVNKFRCIMRDRCDRYEAFADEDGGISVREGDGGLLYRIKGPDAS